MAPRDIDLPNFMLGVGFHPANTPLKQLTHETLRTLVAAFGTALFQLLPPGRDKSLAFTYLEDVLMRSNRAVAINGGPAEHVTEADLIRLGDLLQAKLEEADALGAPVPTDARIDEYKHEQLEQLPFPVPQAVHDQANRPE